MYINDYLNSNLNSNSMALSQNITAKASIRPNSSKTRASDFNDLPTKMKPNMSDGEFKKAIQEQAQKDAANGIYGEKEFKVLEQAYISVSSPDRRGIIGNLFSSIFSRGNPSYVEIKHPSGSPLSDSVIATYSKYRGWEAVGTREEFSRSSEINRIYNEAWKNARYGEGGDSSQETDPRITNGYRGYSKTV